MSKPSHDYIRNQYAHHAPDAEAAALHGEVRRRTCELALWLRDNLPDGRNLSIALTNLEEVRLRANTAVACDWPHPTAPDGATP